jgi:hypothetical protein
MAVTGTPIPDPSARGELAMFRRFVRRPLAWSVLTALAAQLVLVAAAAAARGPGDFPFR